MPSEAARNLLVLATLVALTAGCQPSVAVRGQAASAGAGLTQAPPPKPLLPVNPRPSAMRGRAIFERACWACHGNEGYGDGPAAKHLLAPHKNPMTDFFGMFGVKIKGEALPSRPANFHNQVAMRLTSPFALFETIRLGRPHTAMPAFGPKPAYGATRGSPRLNDAEIWDVLFYAWSFSTTPANVSLGREIFQARAVDVGDRTTICAACHGPSGNGRGGVLGEEMGAKVWGYAQGVGPGIYTDTNHFAQRTPSDLYQRIVDGRGLMPPYRGRLTEAEIWAVVEYLWTFLYDYRPARGQ